MLRPIVRLLNETIGHNNDNDRDIAIGNKIVESLLYTPTETVRAIFFN